MNYKEVLSRLTKNSIFAAYIPAFLSFAIPCTVTFTAFIACIYSPIVYTIILLVLLSGVVLFQQIYSMVKWEGLGEYIKMSIGSILIIPAIHELIKKVIIWMETGYVKPINYYKCALSFSLTAICSIILTSIVRNRNKRNKQNNS